MLLDDIAAFLAANNIGVVGSNIFKGQMPDKPDDCVALYEYGGSPRGLVWNGVQLEYPGLQVMVRSKNYSVARQKIEQITNILHGLSGMLGTTRYLLIRAKHSPESLGRDAAGRVELVVNYEVNKEVG